MKTLNTEIPTWSTAEHELGIVRLALHYMVQATLNNEKLPDWVFRDEQAIVDYYISMARMVHNSPKD